MKIFLATYICVLITYIYSVLEVNGDSSCKPAEEHQAHHIRFIFRNEKREIKDIRISSTTKLIGTCNVDEKNCTTNFPKEFNIYLTDFLITCNFSVEIEIYNASRKSALSYLSASINDPLLEKTNVCEIKYFAKARDLICKKEILKEGINVT
ncbi:unnamed protein product, partial [Lymnaea stagnalis]